MSDRDDREVKEAKDRSFCDWCGKHLGPGAVLISQPGTDRTWHPECHKKWMEKRNG